MKKSSLQPDSVFQKGDPVASDGKKGSQHSASGFSVSVSEADFADLEGQIREAILFLDEYEDELRRLGSFSGVQGVSLEFGIEWREPSFLTDLPGVGGPGSRTGLRQTPVQTDVFPADLLWRAGALDIWLAVTHYFLSKESRDSGASRKN